MQVSLRDQLENDAPVNADGDYVMLWMIANRRLSHNFTVDRAVAWARQLNKPLLVFEALRIDYPHASDRFHAFVMQGMLQTQEALQDTNVRYYPYVEPEPGAASGLLEALARRAAVIVTDNFPCFFLPKMVAAAAKRLPCRLESVDSNGIVPIAAHEKDYKAAAHFRRRMQGILRNHLPNMPVAESLSRRTLPAGATVERHVLQKWPPASAALLEVREDALAALPIDHAVFAVEVEGGAPAAERALKRFIDRRIRKYPDDRNHPDIDATSRLSPYLHFGMISAHQIFKAVADAEDWTLTRLSDENKGARAGWWGMSEGSEAFLDQLITWRELGYNTCAKQPQTYDKYESLPPWARETLEHHEADERPYLYTQTQIENAETHDPVFNSAMRQMREEGWFHNYLRMLWGKKILEWSPNGRTALRTMETIMNRWSLDGRNPNSYSGYFWTLGRYDRGWPERAVFGKVRCMTSKSTRRKVNMEDYLQRFGEPSKSLSLPFDKT